MLRTSKALVAAFVAVVAAVTTVVTLAQGNQEIVVDVDQGWSTDQKLTWYTASQGSRLIPLAWLKELEQAGSDQAFMSADNVRGFRYLPPDPAAAEGLPVGFTVDKQDDTNFSPITQLRWRANQGKTEPWVGMNCAACHTGEVTFQSKRLRIEGAPAISDFQGFMRSLNAALENTKADPAKWRRFTQKVLGTQASDPQSQQMLAGAFDQLLKWQADVQRVNDTPLQYGYGRLDAFGHIYNKVLLRLQATNQPRNPSDAPVSYPFLWNIHQHDKVQWNGVAPNVRLSPDFDIGALGRNVGEVTGVFSDVTITKAGFDTAVGGYTSSADVNHLVALEEQITRLKPPVWPAVFPPIAVAKWERGQQLFRAQCAKCHNDQIPRNDLTTPITAVMTPLSTGADPIRTDPWMACNAYTYNGNTGNLRGSYEGFFPKGFSLFAPRYQYEAPVGDMLGAVVSGSLWGSKDKVAYNIEDSLKKLRPFSFYKAPPGSDAVISALLAAAPATDVATDSLDASKAARLKTCMTTTAPTLAYKGRPLVGVWATGPFLHNGSVPTLYDLLLPPSQRPKSFHVGTREFDPEKVGYAYENSRDVYNTARAKAENTFQFDVVDAAGKPIAGNSNGGHDYGNAALTDDDRWALVEYMKAVAARKVNGAVVP